MKFVPTPVFFNDVEFQADLDSLTNKVKAKCNNFTNPAQRQDADNSFPAVVKPSFSKPSKASSDNTVIAVCQQLVNIKSVDVNRPQKNMSQDLYKALNAIKSGDFIIKEADKGSAVVIMNKDFYVRVVHSMINEPSTYETVNTTCTQLASKVKSFTNKWDSVLNKEEIKVINNHASSLANIYGLPKIHKSNILLEASRNNSTSSVINIPNPDDLKFRPIISCQNCPTTKLCEVLSNLLKPFLSKIKYRLKDTWDFLRRCPDEVTEDTYLITGDITSLYTNITTEKGCEAILYFFNMYASDILPGRFTKDFILDLFTFCQNNLCFTFDGITYRQISGTGMGRIYAPAAADIKVAYQEVQLDSFINSNLSQTVANYFSNSYFRYLDDVFLVWRRSLPGLDQIKDTLNSLDPKIKFIFESSDDSVRPNSGIPFLDVELWVSNNKMITDIYNKPTDTFNYLPFSSSHPRHTARNIPYSLARRIKGIVSEEGTITRRMNEMKARLEAKGYPIPIINDGISKAMALSREQIIAGNSRPSEPITVKPIYFVTTHNTTVEQSTSDIRAAINGFNASRPDHTPLTVKPSFRKSPSIKDQLMYRPLHKPRVRKCGNNCIFCQYIHEGESMILKNGKSVTTNGNFECSSRNVIYIAVCSGCKEYYIGETGDQLLTRWSVHRQQSKLHPSRAPVQADPHFRLCGNNKYTVFPFYRPRRNDVNLRRRYEDTFVQKFKPLLNGNIYER